MPRIGEHAKNRLFGWGASASGQERQDGAARDGDCCLWWRFSTAWTARRQPASAAWVSRCCAIGMHRFNAAGPGGLLDNCSKGNRRGFPRCSRRNHGDRRSQTGQRERRRRAPAVRDLHDFAAGAKSLTSHPGPAEPESRPTEMSL